MNGGCKRALVGASVAMATMAGVTLGAYALSNLLLHLAVDRQMPATLEKNRKKLSGSKEKAELRLKAEQAAFRLRHSGCARVELTAWDGTRLIGHWQEHPHPQRVLVAMHGWRSAWDQDFGLIAPFLEETGCSVLYVQQRGQQESGGSHMTFGILESRDCLSWANWVCSHTADLPIYLAGISMGASSVLMASALPLPKQVKGIIADCGYTSPHAIWQHVSEKNLHLNYALHRAWVERLCRKRLKLQASAASCPEALSRTKLPVLLIHGTADRFVPVEMTYENYRSCAGPRELLIVPGAGHCMSYPTEPKRYEQALLEFWRRWDR